MIPFIFDSDMNLISIGYDCDAFLYQPGFEEEKKKYLDEVAEALKLANFFIKKQSNDSTRTSEGINSIV